MVGGAGGVLERRCRDVISTRTNLVAFGIAFTFVVMTFVATFGWFRYLSVQMVSQGDIREACYLAVRFDDYLEQHGREPSFKDVESFPSRLRFLRIEGDGRYLFACGLYGRDLLIIQHIGSGKFDFFVEENGLRNL